MPSEPNIVLEPISLEDFTKEDMENLQAALDVDPSGNPEIVRNKLLLGTAIPLRYRTPKGNILFIVEENQDNKEKYIFIWYMAGKGIVGYAEFFIKAMEAYAKLRGCASVRSFSLPRIAKYMQRFGFKPQMVAMRKGV